MPDSAAQQTFCDTCREELSFKKSTVKNHIYSGTKHKDTKERVEKKEAREQDIVEALAVRDKSKQPAGKHVSMLERVHRVKVVESFLKAGIPFAKIDDLRFSWKRVEYD